MSSVQVHNALKIDPERVTELLSEYIRETITKKLRKKGGVIGISGGIDSAVVLALTVRALGSDKVFGLMLPERDSSSDSLTLATELADRFKIPYAVEDITPALKGFGCYKRRDEAVRRIFPEYNETYKVKIGLPTDLPGKNILNVFYITIVSPGGGEKKARLPVREFQEIVAASNMKQRSRMMMLYYHAERLNYAVLGTGNKNEHELGFFVKYGDGAADLKPIIHLFKTQIYQLAEYLEIPETIIKRTPTTDTYSAEQTQEEFFYRLPFAVLDFVWSGYENDYSVNEMAIKLNLSEDAVKSIINDIRRKIRATDYLRIVI